MKKKLDIGGSFNPIFIKKGNKWQIDGGTIDHSLMLFLSKQYKLNPKDWSMLVVVIVGIKLHLVLVMLFSKNLKLIILELVLIIVGVRI